MLKNLLLTSLVLLSSVIQATYVYEADQSLIDLTGATGTTNMNASDDGVSNAFNIGFTFDYYGQEFTQARMATNGCLHFKTSGAHCNDYTPDPLTGQHTYTLYPFWTDLIRDGGSKVLAKSYTDKTVFGWYDMKEYGRNNSDNSFEVILWTNDTFEFRYGALDIAKHDVAIGEIGSGATEVYQYLFYDECNTGTTNVSGTCTSTDWNNSSSNTLLEDGGSLYGLGAGNALDCSNALNDSSCAGYDAAYLTQQCDLDSLYNDTCTGYAAAYLTQQCDITQLYDESCPSYWSTYDAQQCEDDSQYSPSCPSYQQEESVAYYTEETEETDYGYTEEDMWYDEEYDEWLEPNDPCYQNNCEDMTDADWYALDIEQFGQEQVDEWYGDEVEFSDEGYIDYGNTSEEEYWTAIDDGMNEYEEEIWQQEELLMVTEELEIWHEEEIAHEELPFIEEEIYLVEIHDIEEERVEYLEETIELEVFTETQHIELNIFDADELTELYEFDTIIREELEHEEEVFAIREEIEEEREEEMEELQEEDELMELEEAEERFVEAEEETKTKRKTKKGSSAKISALEVVANTLRSARASVSTSAVSTSAVSTSAVSTSETAVGAIENQASEIMFSDNSNVESSNATSSVVNFTNTFNAGSVVSFSGTNYGSTTSSSSAINVSSSNVVSASSTSTGGISTSSSPSRSDQFASSSAQTQQVLSMSAVAITDTAGSSSSFGGSSSSVTINITPMPTVDNSPQVVMAEVQVTNMDNQIDTAVSGVMTASEADQVADKIIAQNIETQQEQAEEELQETGEYADQSTLVAYLGYVPGFNSYRDAQIPNQDSWYTPRSIYANANIPDNTEAFYGLAGTSLNRLKEMIDLQPTL